MAICNEGQLVTSYEYSYFGKLLILIPIQCVYGIFLGCIFLTVKLELMLLLLEAHLLAPQSLQNGVISNKKKKKVHHPKSKFVSYIITFVVATSLETMLCTGA